MLNSNFIKPKLSIDFFGKTRFWLGLFLGLGYGVLMYYFFYFLNLGMYYFCYMDWTGFTVTTPAETQFYYFLFAFAAFLFGQNIFFEFTLSRSKAFRKNTSREFTILHHSRMATWYTLFAGFAWCTTLKLLAFSNVFWIYDFFKIGWWASILVMLWLHFYAWMQVSNFFKNVYPIKIFTFLGIAILSFGLSHYDPVPHIDSLRNKAKNLTQYRLKIQPPTISDSLYTKLRNKNVIQTIFVGDPDQDGIANYGINNTIATIEDLPLFFENFNAKVPESRRGLILNSLVIDKNLKMKEVYKLLRVLGENNRLKISFSALTEGQNNPDVYYEYFDKGLLSLIPPQCNDLQSAVELINENPKTTIENLITIYDPPKKGNLICIISFPHSKEDYQADFDYIKLSAQNEFSFNHEKIVREDLFLKIKNTVSEKKEKAIFVFEVADKATYEHYFFLRHEYKRAMNKVRNQEALISFGKKYEFLDRPEQKEIRAKYPMIYEEFFSEEERFIFDFFRDKYSN